MKDYFKKEFWHGLAGRGPARRGGARHGTARQGLFDD
jgi:hypothetical protein